MCRLEPGAIEHRELNHFRQIRKPAPGGKLRDVVFADQVNELRIGLAAAKRFDCFDGVRRRRTLELQRIEAESRLAFNCRSQHFHPRLSIRWRSTQLVRRERGRNENELVELQLFDRIPREDQMSMVNGIKSSAEDADLLSQ